MFDLQTLSLHHDAQQGVGELKLRLTPAAWALSHRCIAQTHACFPVFCVPDSLCVTKSKCKSSIVVPYLASHLISLWTRGYPITMALCLCWSFPPWLALWKGQPPPSQPPTTYCPFTASPSLPLSSPPSPATQGKKAFLLQGFFFFSF